MLLALLCFIPGHEIQASSQAEVRPAVVHLEGGSGVCVSPDGWIVTAAHMLPGWPFDRPDAIPMRDRRRDGACPMPQARRPPASVPVRFGSGPPMQAKVCVIRDRDKQSDLAVLKVNATGLPFRPVATKTPVVGDACLACGWPAGNWYWNECRIVGIKSIPSQLANGDRETLDMIETNHLSGGGASGGPLLNVRGEVIGICSRSAVDSRNQHSLFSRWDHVVGCLLEAGYSPLSVVSASEPTLIVFGTAWCGPCAQFKADFEAGIDCNGQPLQQVFRVQFCDVDQSPDLARKLGVTRVPAFVVDGHEPIIGYEGPQWLAQRLCRYQFPIVVKPPEVVVPAPVPASPAPAPPQTPFAPKPKETQAETPFSPDPTALRVLVLIKRRGSLGGFDWIKGVALSRAERIVERRFPEAVKERLGNKVRAEIVFQRTNPTRYDEMTAAAGVNESQVTAVVLVAGKFDGVVGRLTEFVETKLQDLAASHGETVDVELIFERTSGDRYHAVIDALGEPEPSIAETIVTMGGGGVAVGAASAGLWAWFRRKVLGTRPRVPAAAGGTP